VHFPVLCECTVYMLDKDQQDALFSVNLFWIVYPLHVLNRLTTDHQEAVTDMQVWYITMHSPETVKWKYTVVPAQLFPGWDTFEWSVLEYSAMLIYLVQYTFGWNCITWVPASPIGIHLQIRFMKNNYEDPKGMMCFWMLPSRSVDIPNVKPMNKQSSVDGG
jgi:hypothetical protein